jgi:hypothetical protein
VDAEQTITEFCVKTAHMQCSGPLKAGSGPCEITVALRRRGPGGGGGGGGGVVVAAAVAVVLMMMMI